MLKSMTAFGRARREAEDKDITVELRSVNSRYFDCSVKLPRAYLCFEEKIKAYLQANATSRAKLDVSVYIEEHGKSDVEIGLDDTYLRGYLAALGRLRDEYGLADDMSVMSVARNGEVFDVRRREIDVSGEWARIEAVLAEAVAGYNAMREAEGARIEADLFEKMESIRTLTERIARLSREHISGYKEKLRARLQAVLEDQRVTADENRILTECAIMADKLAVDEELVRLGSHLTAFAEIAASGEPAGRKLDFLMQEINREINTTGSKCANAEIARIVVEVKCELEKIREQIQNIE